MNLNHPLEQVVAEGADRVIFSYSTGTVTYAAFYDAVRRLARGLERLDVHRGDRITIMMPNVPHFPISFYAAMRIGAVAVPINTMYTGREVAWLLEDSEAKVLIIWEGMISELRRYFPLLGALKHIIVLGESEYANAISLTKLIAGSHQIRDISPVDEDDPVVIQYTSGVTGTHKGVELSHGNILSNVNACRDLMRVVPEDRFLTAVPFFTPLGQTMVMHLAIATGAAMELHPTFEPADVSRSFTTGSSSLFVGVPSMFQLVLNERRRQPADAGEGNFSKSEPAAADLSLNDSASGEDSAESDEAPHVRLSICGDGGIPEDVLKEFETEFNTYILECYTTAETSPVISFNQWRTGRRVGSLGHPIPGVEMRVVDENGEEVSIGEVGEITVKGSNVMRGYINRPRLSAEVLKNGWFHTGDLGKMDINGFFYLVDRLNDRIIKGGFSIYPTEVESVLYGHPDVKETAIVPVPDEIMGQEIKACVVLKENATVTTEQLAEYCRERMAKYKVPAIIRFYKDLPRTSTDRINRQELKK